MRPANPLPPRETLLDLFRYEPETGRIFWRGKASRKHHPGMETGLSLVKGYPQVRIEGRNYAVHRIVWKMETGVDPIEIDHRNGVRHDNRWANLREATSSQNKVNREGVNRHKGVHWIKARSKFGAQIKAAGRHEWLGVFDTAEAACAAYRARAVELHGEFRKAQTCSCR